MLETRPIHVLRHKGSHVLRHVDAVEPLRHVLGRPVLHSRCQRQTQVSQSEKACECECKAPGSGEEVEGGR